MGMYNQRILQAEALNHKTSYNYDMVGRLSEIISSSGSTHLYDYNDLDQISNYTNGRQQVTNYTYDALGRQKTRTDNLGTITYTYDASENLTNVTDGSEALNYTYDKLGRISSYTDAASNTISYEYDDAGRLTTLTYPGQKSVTYSYDAGNRLINVTDWNNRITSYTYDNNGRLIRTNRADGTYEEYSYNTASQLVDYIDKDANNQIINHTTYAYNDDGRLISETNLTSNGQVEANNYSNLDRLINQDVTKNGQTTETYNYTYDAGGNILTTTKNGLTDVYTYGLANQLSTYNQNPVIHDADGNITNATVDGFAITYSYDCRNRLTTAGAITFEYDLQDRRTAKTENNIRSTYLQNPQTSLPQILMKTVNGVSTYYIYGIGLIAEDNGTDYKTYHFDLRGSTIAVTDYSGIVIDTYDYGPYGELLNHYGTSQVDYLYNGRDGVITDSEDLYYMRARYYSTDLRRFLSEDDFAGKYDDISAINLYGFVNGDPILGIDPSGYFLETAVDVVSIGFSAKDLYDKPSWSNLGYLIWDVSAAAIPMIPGSWTVKGMKAGAKGLEAFKYLEKGKDVIQGGSKAGWKLGDDINVLTKQGNYPSWSTAKSRYWKNAANAAEEGEYSAENLAKMT